MQAPVRDWDICGSLHGALRTTRIEQVLNKFGTRSEQIIQNIYDIIWDDWGYKVILIHGTWRLLFHCLFAGLLV